VIAEELTESSAKRALPTVNQLANRGVVIHLVIGATWRGRRITAGSRIPGNGRFQEVT
jgi:hypothetical protein